MNMTVSFLKLLPDVKHAGVYQSTVDPDEIVAAAKTTGLHVFRLDIGRAHGKNQLLGVFARALKFPNHFGKNWDALSDCLTDLSWLDGKGWVLIIGNGKTFAENYQEDFAIAIDILKGAVECWREEAKVFWVLVQTQDGWDPELPKITDIQ
jgi:RNAse (barnase) inhibitor barstar